MDKESEIKNLEDKLTEANALITCLQQENMQFNVNQMIQNKYITKLKKEDAKGKIVVQLDDSEDK